MVEVNRRGTRARVHPKASRIDRFGALRLDLEAVAGKGEPVSDNVIGRFAVSFGLCCSPGPFQGVLRVDRVRAGENEFQVRGSTRIFLKAADAYYLSRERAELGISICLDPHSGKCWLSARSVPFC